MHRFYVPESLDSPEIDLADEEAHHLARVLRLMAGDRVELFDGRGAAVLADVVRLGKRSVALRTAGVPVVGPPRSPRITLLTAAPKSDRLRWLVEKATELGVDRLSLVASERSVVHPGSGKIDKLAAVVIAACKQCGRNDLMSIDAPQRWEEIAAQWSNATSSAFFVAHPDGISTVGQFASVTRSPDVVLAIGPEGGWTDEEIACSRAAGATLISLGSSVLRIETAAIAAAGAVRLASCDTQ